MCIHSILAPGDEVGAGARMPILLCSCHRLPGPLLLAPRKTDICRDQAFIMAARLMHTPLAVCCAPLPTPLVCVPCRCACAPCHHVCECSLVCLQVIGDSAEGGLLAACAKFKEWVQKTYFS